MLALNSVVDDGSFHILDVLGTGGSGVAYLAFDIHKSTSEGAQYYAIKCLRNANQSSILREVRLHRSVSRHENIVTLCRSVPEGEFQILIMDYCPDGDLFWQITQKYRYFGNDELIGSVFLQIIDAVAYCHSCGVYHRDLQPENILCSHDGTKVYLADFGLATQDRISYEPGVGKACYMSPECSAGPKYDSAMNDVWSLGIILLNLCYGRNPWTRADYSNPTFCAFLQDQDYLNSIFPIPRAVNEILKEVFALNSQRRATLDRLRAAILEIDHFCMDRVELRSAKAEARSVAANLKKLIAARASSSRVAESGSTEASASPNSDHAPAYTPVVSRSGSIVSLRTPKPLYPTFATRPNTHPFHPVPNSLARSLGLIPSGSTPSSEKKDLLAPSVVSRSLGTILHKSSSLIGQARAQAASQKLASLKSRMSLDSILGTHHSPPPDSASSPTRRSTVCSFNSRREHHSSRKSSDSCGSASMPTPSLAPSLSHFDTPPTPIVDDPYPCLKRVSLPSSSWRRASGDHWHSIISDDGQFLTPLRSTESEGSFSPHPFALHDEGEKVAVDAESLPAPRDNPEDLVIQKTARTHNEMQTLGDNRMSKMLVKGYISFGLLMSTAAKCF